MRVMIHDSQFNSTVKGTKYSSYRGALSASYVKKNEEHHRTLRVSTGTNPWYSAAGPSRLTMVTNASSTPRYCCSGPESVQRQLRASKQTAMMPLSRTACGHRCTREARHRPEGANTCVAEWAAMRAPAWFMRRVLITSTGVETEADANPAAELAHRWASGPSWSRFFDTIWVLTSS